MVKQNYWKGTNFFLKKEKCSQVEINVSDTSNDSVNPKIAQNMKLTETEWNTPNVKVCETGKSQVYQDQR